MALGWLTVTVTASPPTLTVSASGRSVVTRSAAEPGSRRRIGGHGRRPGGLPGRQLDGELVAADERHLQHPEQEHHHHRQRQRQLDGGLPGDTASTGHPLRPCR